jgi:hypothetical protein
MDAVAGSSNLLLRVSISSYDVIPSRRTYSTYFKNIREYERPTLAHKIIDNHRSPVLYMKSESVLGVDHILLSRMKLESDDE